MVKVKVRAVANIGRLVTGGTEQVVALPGGSTLLDLLEKLAADSGEGFRRRIFSSNDEEAGAVRKDIRLLVNGRDYIFINGLDSVLEDGDTVSIMPLMGGG